MGLIQRICDEMGLVTISLTTVKEIAEQVKASRVVFVEHPFGYTLGDVGDWKTQRAVLSDTLKAVEEIRISGNIYPLPYKWTKNDLRERQMRKEAH